jgi:hypothetical protein
VDTTGPRPAAGPALVGITTVAVLAGVVRATRPLLTGTDPFWHYDLGRRIVAGGLPRTDPYSFLRDGHEWILNQWGTEAVFGVVDRIGGLGLLALFAALLVGAAYGVTGWAMWRRAPTLATMLLFGAVVLASMSNWSLRGNLFTFLLLPVFLTELLRDDGPRPVVVVPLLVVWANLHAAYLFGVGLLLLWLVGTWAVASPDDAAWLRRRAPVLVVGGLLAGLVTPYGPRFLVSTLELTTRAGGAGISEWTPAPLTRIDVLPYTFLVGVVLVALAVAARRQDLPEALMVVAAVLFGATAIRNLATASIVVGVVGAPYVSSALRQVRRVPDGAPRPPSGLDRLLVGVVGVVGLVLVLAVVPRSGAVAAHLGNNTAPLDLIDRLDASPGEERVVTTSTWSGAVAALTGDHVRTAVDGRLELFSDEEIQVVRDLESADPGWQGTFDRWCVTAVLIPADAPLDRALDDSGAWTMAAEAGDDENRARLWAPDRARPCKGR